MNFEQKRKLSIDSKFNRILEVSISKIAGNVMPENMTEYQQTGLTKRHNAAVRIIEDVQNMRKKFSLLITNTSEVNELITVEGDKFGYPEDMTNLDTAIDVACNDNFNIVAGLTFAEMQAQEPA